MSELWSAFYKRFDGKVEIHGFGKPAGDFDKYQIATIAHQLEVDTILWPDTRTFNAEIGEPAELKQQEKIGGVRIYRGHLADGVVIPLSQAACLRTADCPTIVTRHDLTGEVIAAHAGRASLVDQKMVETGQPSRQLESLVHRICKRTTDFGRQTLIDFEIYSCCGIGPMQFRHPTDHPQYGLSNAKMNHHIALHYGTDCFLDGNTSWGALDLHRLIHNQFQLCGVPRDNIHHDQVDTAGDREKWFSRRGGDRIGHNTILVIRRV